MYKSKKLLFSLIRSKFKIGVGLKILISIKFFSKNEIKIMEKLEHSFAQEHLVINDKCYELNKLDLTLTFMLKFIQTNLNNSEKSKYSYTLFF